MESAAQVYPNLAELCDQLRGQLGEAVPSSKNLPWWWSLLLLRSWLWLRSLLWQMGMLDVVIVEVDASVEAGPPSVEAPPSL